METNLEEDCCPLDSRDRLEHHDGRHFGKLDAKQDFDNRCESGYKSVDEGFNSVGSSTCLSERVPFGDEHKLESVSEDDETREGTIESIDEGISSINLSTEILQNRNSELKKSTDREILCHNAYQQDEDGDTHLHLSVIQILESLSLDIINLALDAEYLSIQNNYLQTPLHLAVITKQPLLVRKLITAGAELDIRDHYGNTPLHIACKEGESLIVKLILQPVTLEERRNNPYKLQVRQTRQNLDARNYEGQVCVHLAAERGNCEILQDLINYGANINARDGKSGRSILHYAAESGCERLAQFLLGQAGIDVNSETYGGLTPLKLAKGRRHTGIVKMLKERGAYYYSDASSEDEMETESISDDYAIGGKPVSYRD